MIRIHRALISVSDKTGLAELGQALAAAKVDVLSTGGTAAALREAVHRHRGWMRAAGTTAFESKSGYGLDRDTELASIRAIRAEGGVATWLGAHAVPPEFASADAYLDFALTEVLPEAARLAQAADELAPHQPVALGDGGGVHHMSPR